MNINPVNSYSYKYNTAPSFGAKFLYTESLEQVAKFAVKRGKFESLNIARKNIDKGHLRTRLMLDVGEDNGRPFVIFTRLFPKQGIIEPKIMDDYKVVKRVVIQSSEKKHKLKFALEKLIKLGNNVPENNLYKKIIIEK